MRKLVVIEFVTLDGVMQGLKSTTAYLVGRKTYEKMIGYWPSQTDQNPMAAHLNATPKYVASRTLTSLTWSNSEVLDGELVSAVRDLKAQGDGNIAVLGSGVLVQDLIANDVVDGYRLFLHPLLLGTGKRLFRETDRPTRLRLVDCTPTTTGVLMLTYDRV